MSKKGNRSFSWGCAAALAVGGALIGASAYFYKVAVKREEEKTFLLEHENLERVFDETHTLEREQWLCGQAVEDVFIQSKDGLRLHALYIASPVRTKKTIILAHGYTGVSSEMGSLARLYLEDHQYNILMPDNRGHGRSQGDYVGFGWPDRLDFLQWIDYTIQRTGTDSSVVLHGISMGGATVLMTSGEKLPPQVKAVISDCAYTSAEDILSYHLKQMYRLPRFPILYTTSLWTKMRAGYCFREASALNQVKKAQVPILYIHGEKDTFVPREMVYSLFQATGSDKELLIVPYAEHGHSFDTNPVMYERKVRDFLEEHV
ncbi:alpha/beta hydrolase [Shouchella shacheensis]|uniref:alpha/beta hydrolase n=1 Tax=Shouchella shacheensis TaxID=1649580 RepID=UPI0009EB3651|nr:alpha/beta hydrolase [Shouchella shacheensis]